jgi:hypothetical protein
MGRLGEAEDQLNARWRWIPKTLAHLGSACLNLLEGNLPAAGMI